MIPDVHVWAVRVNYETKNIFAGFMEADECGQSHR
jgi:hypothetical protein